MDEQMNALRLVDNKQVTVKRKNKYEWIDVNTNNVYLIHIDIELLYK